MKYILYDLEIKTAIPSGALIAGIEYCAGWKDYRNMHISVVGFCEILTGGDNPKTLLDAGELFLKRSITVGAPQYVIADEYGLDVFAKLARDADGLIGFNSKAFDDQVMNANGYPVHTTYDLLEAVRIAAYGSPHYQDAPPGSSYKLSRLAAFNGQPNLSSGENAAIQWQSGQHREVINHCCEDVAAAAGMLYLGLAGNLKDPNTGAMLQLRDLQ